MQPPAAQLKILGLFPPLEAHAAATGASATIITGIVVRHVAGGASRQRGRWHVASGRGLRAGYGHGY